MLYERADPVFVILHSHRLICRFARGDKLIIDLTDRNVFIGERRLSFGQLVFDLVLFEVRDGLVSGLERVLDFLSVFII